MNRRFAMSGGFARAAAGVFLLVACFGAAGASRRAGETGLGEGLKPPAFQTVDLEGRPQSLKAHAGDVVILHFWATWCPYCRAEVPKLSRVHRELASRGVTVLSVSVDEDISRLREYVSANKIPYVVIPDGSSGFAVAGDYAVSGIPVTYVIGRDGRLLGRVSGPADIFGIVESVLAAPSDPT